ncbi:MAG: hypothetical protein QM767_24070 [Anaeromyxobacter sp.]
MALFVVLGFVLLLSWLVGYWALPGVGLPIHVPLLLALACFGIAAARKRPRETPPGAR